MEVACGNGQRPLDKPHDDDESEQGLLKNYTKETVALYQCCQH